MDTLLSSKNCKNILTQKKNDTYLILNSKSYFETSVDPDQLAS